MVLRQSLVGGKSAARYSIIGNSTGLLIWGALSAVGLSAIFAKSHAAFSVLKYAGVAFLTFLSLQTLWQLRKEFGRFDFDSGAKTSFGGAYRLGLITNLMNVKAAVFAVAFIPSFVPKHFSLGWGIFILACVQASISTSWYVTLVAAVNKASVFLDLPAVRRSQHHLPTRGLRRARITLPDGPARLVRCRVHDDVALPEARPPSVLIHGVHEEHLLVDPLPLGLHVLRPLLFAGRFFLSGSRRGD